MKRTVIRVSADQVARAVIAAAWAYGDDPLVAMATESYLLRRSLGAAASGLARALGLPMTRASALLGLAHGVVREARRKARPGFAEAEMAAELAVREGLSRAPVAHARAKARAALTPKPAVRSAGAVRREVLICLGEDPSTVPELAQLVGVAAAQIREAISVLQGAGRITCGPRPQADWRARTWRLSAGAGFLRSAATQFQGEALQ